MTSSESMFGPTTPSPHAAASSSPLECSTSVVWLSSLMRAPGIRLKPCSSSLWPGCGATARWATLSCLSWRHVAKARPVGLPAWMLVSSTVTQDGTEAVACSRNWPSGWLNKHPPKDVHIPNPGNHQYAILHGKGDFVDGIKLRILKWTNGITRVLKRGRWEGRSQN